MDEWINEHEIVRQGTDEGAFACIRRFDWDYTLRQRALVGLRRVRKNTMQK